MNKLEAKFTTKLQKWMAHYMPLSFLGEVKYVRAKSYNFNSDKSFQKEMTSLLIAGRSFIYKFPDFSRMGTPCDLVKLHECTGYFFFTWDGKEFEVIEVSELKRFIDEGNTKLDRNNVLGQWFIL